MDAMEQLIIFEKYNEMQKALSRRINNPTKYEKIIDLMKETVTEGIEKRQELMHILLYDKLKLDSKSYTDDPYGDGDQSKYDGDGLLESNTLHEVRNMGFDFYHCFNINFFCITII